MKYNFAFKDSKLKKWISPSISLKEKQNQSNYYKLFINYIINNPVIIAPSLIGLIIFGSINILSLAPKNKISAFENAHYEFNNLNYQINKAINKKQEIQSKYNSFEIFHTELAPIYLFAFYLQNAIPEKVSINEIIIDQYAYKIIADSPNLDFLNKMVTLLIESPLINIQTIAINEIFNDKSSSEDNKVNESLFNAEIKGSLESLSLKDKMSLYAETSANGLLKKLIEFKNLGELFN